MYVVQSSQFPKQHEKQGYASEKKIL